MEKRNEFLPFAKPLICDEEKKEVIDALESGWISAGPKTKQFEEDFKNYIKCKHAISVNSCTSALHISLTAFNIKTKDEVITTPFTFTSSASTIMHCGAKPIFADVTKDTFNIDPDEIKKKITPKTKAIVPVHYGGHPCDMHEILAIAKEHDLFIIEDAAHAVGAEYENKKIGAFGNTTCFSFYATKNMTTGEGGMITTDDDILSEKLKLLRWYGINNKALDRYLGMGSWYYEVEHAGFKYNMSDINAAMGLHQLKKLDNFIAVREKYAQIYDKELECLGITVPFIKPNVKHARHLYPILLPKASYRNKVISLMKDWNVGTSVHFIPLHFHSYYKKHLRYNKGAFPVAENIYSKLITLPLYPAMRENDVYYVCDVIKTVLRGLENG